MKNVCTFVGRRLNFWKFLAVIITPAPCLRQEKTRQLQLPRIIKMELLLAEGHAVGALIHSGIVFVGTHQNPVQRTIVLVFTMMGTLVDSAFNTLVCVVVHNIHPPFCWVLH